MSLGGFKDAGIAFLKKEAYITFVSRIVSACCMLHNFCEVQKEEFLEGEIFAEGERVGEHEVPAHDEQVHACVSSNKTLEMHCVDTLL